MDFRAIWAMVAVMPLPVQALAWRSEGHSTAAELAQRRLVLQAAAAGGEPLLEPAAHCRPSRGRRTKCATIGQRLTDGTSSTWRWQRIDTTLRSTATPPKTTAASSPS